MNEVVDGLASDLLGKVSSLPATKRYLVGVAGIPGSGKSTLARHVCDAVNAKLGAKEDDSVQATVVGMDGWHFSRAVLEGFPDPQEAKDRRGAAFTFDAKSFAGFVKNLQARPQDTVRAPSFSHSVKDPVPDDIEVLPLHKLVIIEGLYCNCDAEHWAEGASVLDERWVVQVDRDIARERLRIRHVQTGVAADEQEALWRADNSDLPNGEWLMSHLLEPVKRLRSREDLSWA